METPGMEGAYTLECFSDEHVHLEKIADVRRKVHIRIHCAAIRTC